ncbi:MAG TPA: hypothetical protein VLL97_03005, partial [Acidobacteriota bacterium]|nr:hypothetical protein [Acidobacteriota bacterium]
KTERWTHDFWLEATAKRLERAKKTTHSDPDIVFLKTKTSDLVDQAKQWTNNQFRSGRLVMAANALLDAADRIVWSRAVEQRAREKDVWGAGFILQGCYFRVRQADYFAMLSGDKDSGQFVTLSRSLYQQARSAYDAGQFQRARLLGDASSFIVFSLESIAQGVTPDPDIYK